MDIFVLWVTLVTGDRIMAGQYYNEESCYHAAQQQRVFWLDHRPRPKRMDCKAEAMWFPKERG